MVAVTACGRIGFDGFDPRSEGGPGAGPTGDSGEGEPDAGPTGDGGEVSSGPCTPFDRTIAGEPSPGLAWIGDAYALYTTVATDIGTLRVGIDGATGPLIPIVTSAATAHAGRDQIAWTGNRLGTMWTDDGALEFKVLDHDLAAASDAHQLIPTAGVGAHMAWADDRFVVAWTLGASVNLVEVGSDGTVLAGKNYPGAPSSVVSTVAVAPSSYLIATGTSVFSIPRPIGSTATATHTLGFSSGELDLDLIPFGAGFVALNNAEGLQLLDATGAATSPVLPVPGLTNPLFGARLAPFGNGLRIIGYSGPSDDFKLVWIDFDPATQQFGAVNVYGLIPTDTPWNYPISVIGAPGRLLIASTAGDRTSQLLLLQQCVR